MSGIEIALLLVLLVVSYIGSRSLVYRAGRRALKLNGNLVRDFPTWAIVFVGVFMSLNLAINLVYLAFFR